MIINQQYQTNSKIKLINSRTRNLLHKNFFLIIKIRDVFFNSFFLFRRFQHKNLVSIHGVCSEVEPLFIVVEYMIHGSLHTYLRNHKDIMRKPDLLTNMVFQVVCAMKYLEAEKFIHRDLVIANIHNFFMVKENTH